MGVLNLTPDSFSDGGKFNKTNKGIKHAFEMISAGANLIDVGGESTRPGSKTVNPKNEWNRIYRILRLVCKKVPVSLDTRKSEIMEKGIKLGVKIINDVSGLNYDKKTLDILKKYQIPFVIQHSKGTPENMQIKPTYKNELLEIYDFFEKKIKTLRSIGIKHSNII
jgi:dihydropteroate synthase